MEAAYCAFFDALALLEQALAGEAQRLQETDAFQQAPQPLRDALLNYKQGIEIIHRMVKRVQDRKTSDITSRETLATVKSLLAALDGIDSGRRSEPELLAGVADFRAEYGALIDSWFGTYDRMEQALQAFFAASELEPIVVEPGTPFSPDTMEPGGTVADPNRKNDEVASTLRRGFRFAGVLIRPALVEVVINTAGG